MVAEVAQVNSHHPMFPGNQAGVKLGLCVSGGGTRALSFTLGVYRELWSLGIMNKLDCISSVSGGTWASAIFMFANEYKGEAISTDELLGELTDPGHLRMDVLNREPAPLARGATKHGLETVLKFIGRHFLGCCPLDEIQQRIVGELYLKDFGLESMDAFMAGSEADRQRITSQNEHLKAAQFLVPRTNRPRTFVMNGVLLAPFGYEADGNSAVSLQISPDYTGCPFYPDDSTLTYKHAGPLSRCSCCQKNMLIGGGLVETFAFNGAAPKAGDQSGGRVEVSAPKGIPMSLCQAAGISSDEAGSLLQLSAIAGRYVTPSIHYWPVTSEEFPAAQPAAWFNASDGGNLENSGLLALLQRGAKKVIMVASSYRGLNPDYDISAATVESFDPVQACVTEDLFDKFGYGYDTKNNYYSHNQVFLKEKLLHVVKEIASLKKQGRPAVVRAQLEVVENRWWGIMGGRSVDLLIIYLEKVADFEEALPADTQHELSKGKDGSLSGYPILSTGLSDMKACQVNLLAAQGEYCVRESRDEIKQFCN